MEIRRGGAELQPVLKALRGGGIHIVPFTTHDRRKPASCFSLLGPGNASNLAKTVKQALDLNRLGGKKSGA